MVFANHLACHSLIAVYESEVNMEVWKEVVGYEGLYLVSDTGRIQNAKTNRILRPCTHKIGYQSVMLYRNGNCKRMLVHRIVADAFVVNPHGYYVVNHIDENKANNTASNLEWCSAQKNMNHGTINDRLSAVRGHDARAKRKVNQIDVNGVSVAVWESIAEASRATNTSKTSILNCCKGKQKTANGYAWKYCEDGKIA